MKVNYKIVITNISVRCEIVSFNKTNGCRFILLFSLPPILVVKRHFILQPGLIASGFLTQTSQCKFNKHRIIEIFFESIFGIKFLFVFVSFQVCFLQFCGLFLCISNSKLKTSEVKRKSYVAVGTIKHDI